MLCARTGTAARPRHACRAQVVQNWWGAAGGTRRDMAAVAVAAAETVAAAVGADTLTAAASTWDSKDMEVAGDDRVEPRAQDGGGRSGGHSRAYHLH